MAHDDDDDATSIGQPTGQHSLDLCGQGEGKAWKGDRARFPGVHDPKRQLVVPKPEGDNGDGVYLDYAIVRGPRGGKRKVFVGFMLAHEHSLSRESLRKAYDEFASRCNDAEMARYARIQALAKTPQADGTGNRYAAQRDMARHEPAPVVERTVHGTPPHVQLPQSLHLADCLCYACLLAR